jgi:hypothetical protein
MENELIHKAIARHRIRNSVDWVELGKVRYELDPRTGLILRSHTVLKCLPIGGFDGYILGLPFDAPLPSLHPPTPPRPGGQPSDDEGP